MSALNDLIAQISDEGLRQRIQQEADKLAKQKKFGLVFEEHLPECTPLYDIPVKKGGKVALRDGNVNDTYTVLKIENGTAYCVKKDSNEVKEVAVADLITVAEFGDPIYPYLKPLDSVCNAPDSDLWHTLIEADNYHALQFLEYLYAGKVDCIYIDPPYNTGARDWKYNNDYVDGADEYRHSKWLSMMQKRLKLAKKLLNPADSVLIVTIDEKEYLHLGCLLEEMFSEAKIQMISSVINHGSVARDNEFNRNNEYIFFVMIGDFHIQPLEESKNFLSGDGVQWRTLRRTNADNTRSKTKSQFYPIYVDVERKIIKEVGLPLPPSVNVCDIPSKNGCIPVFPIRDNGIEMMWGLTRDELLNRMAKGYVRVTNYNPQKPQVCNIEYLPSGTIEDIENGIIETQGYNADGSIIAVFKKGKAILPKTQWDNVSHDARDQGTRILKSIFGTSPFSFPKSIYAVHDAIQFFVAHKKNSLIVDFFAGSGTTLHAVNLLNAEDGGHRRCILVTNNEVSEAENKELTAKGYKPGDEEWDKLGIARYVTWPRTVCSIKGVNVKGEPLKGNYIGSDIPMSQGFKANASFFKLGFLDKTAVALGMQFKEMLPTLWMKAGAHGKCPENTDIPKDMLILPENRMAILINENAFSRFEEELKNQPAIDTVFIITDYESNYRAMVKNLNVKETYQLYRDYLDNFRINHGRN